MLMAFIVLFSVTLGLYQNHVHLRQGLISGNPSSWKAKYKCDGIVMMLSN